MEQQASQNRKTTATDPAHNLTVRIITFRSFEGIMGEGSIWTSDGLGKPNKLTRKMPVPPLPLIPAFDIQLSRLPSRRP